MLDNIDMLINAKKSYCIRIGPRFKIDCHPLVTKDNCELKWCGSIRYLGVSTLHQRLYFGVQSVITNRQLTEHSMRYLAKLVGQLQLK